MITTEIQDNIDTVKANYNKMKLFNGVLAEKLILVDRVSKVEVVHICSGFEKNPLKEG